MSHFQSAIPTVITIAIYTTFLYHAQSQSATTSTTNAPNTKYSTIIMGAGMSGISAAKTLYDAGETNFIVLEAQDYIGGRTKTVEFGGLSGLNVGGSWFSGGCENSSKDNCRYWTGVGPTEINPMLAIATQNGYTFVNTKWSDLIALGANAEDQTNEYLAAEATMGIVWECIYNMSSAAHSISLSQALIQCGWDSTAVDSASKSVEFNWFVWGNAISPDLLSADVLTETSKELYGDQDNFITDSRGYQGITEIVATDFVDKIRLNSAIKTIAYDATNGVTVTLDDGEILSSHYGIITFSLGVLQSELVTFSPQVPSWKSTAWNKFGMSHFSPILIKWPYDFWSATAGTKWWYILNDDRFGYYINVMNLDHDDLYKDSLIWRIDLTADVSIQVQKQNISQIQDDIVTKLSLYFDNVPQPEDIVIQRWSENEYIQGAYMFWPPKTTVVEQEEIKRNIDGVLYFAGEHTLPDNGYVHTAYLSGISAANEVLQSMSTSTTSAPSSTPPSSASTLAPSLDPLLAPSSNPVSSAFSLAPSSNPSSSTPTLPPQSTPTFATSSNPTKNPSVAPAKSNSNSISLGPSISVDTTWSSITSEVSYSINDKKDKREKSQMVQGIDDDMLRIFIFAVVGIILCCFCVICVCLWNQNRKYKQTFDEVQDDEIPDDIGYF